MWDVHAPCVEHLQALSLAGLVTHLWRDVACVAPLLVVCPLPRQGQPEVEQRMVVCRDIAHEDTDLAVVNFAPVATPLTFDADRMGAALGETTRIEGDNAIGLAQAMDHLRHQHLDQRAMIPGRRANERLDDQSLDMDERGDVLGIFAGQVRQHPLEIEGIRLRWDSWVSVMYAEELNSTKSSGFLQRTVSGDLKLLSNEQGENVG